MSRRPRTEPGLPWAVDALVLPLFLALDWVERHRVLASFEHNALLHAAILAAASPNELLLGRRSGVPATEEAIPLPDRP